MAAAQPNRLPRGGRIDRTRPLEFTFDGRALAGFAGDTLASALIANDVRLVGRSFRFRRPRGIVGSGAEEPNAILQIGDGAAAQPNLPATRVDLHDGLVARTTRGWPGVRLDVGAINDVFGRMLGAGFYYKTFMYPRSWWRHYEHAIRRAAGFGHAPEAPDPDRYEHMNAHCDVLVAGGGPAGLMAALTAAKSGARVILADEQSEFGGTLLASTDSIAGAPAMDWVAAAVTELRGRQNCTLLPRSTVFGYHDHNFLTVAERCTDPPNRPDAGTPIRGPGAEGRYPHNGEAEGPREAERRRGADSPDSSGEPVRRMEGGAHFKRHSVDSPEGSGDPVRRGAGSGERHDRSTGRASERLWRIRARQAILAQGSFERPLVFCNNDRPGVMLASAVSTWIHRYGVLPGRRAVVFTNNDSAYRAAIDLTDAGVEVAAIVDSREGGAAELGRRARERGIAVLEGHVVSDVTGRQRVRAVSVARWHGESWATVSPAIRIDCDLVVMSGGYSPAVHLHSQAGGRLAWNESRLCFLPAESRQANLSAGAGNGRHSLEDCLSDGLRAGREAVSRLGLTAPAISAPSAAAIVENPIEALWRVPAAKDADRCAKQFIDFQNDTTVADIRLAAREGYRNVEHVKRYTALGFGTDQGKLGNINGMAVLAETLGKAIPEVGTTTFRPAYTPVSFGVGAGESVGELYDPVRKSAIHEWHEAADAPMEVVGQWRRPWYFPRDGEDLHAAVARECLAVRNSVGLMDASTLGKIDACGPDVVEFLERIYTHDVGRMNVGRCAYGIMLGEDGMLMDDGVTARVGEHRFYLTTTTGGAANVLNWLEKWLQTEWPELEVYLTSLTEQYSTFALAGPDSRKLLDKLGCNVPLDKDRFPFMSVRPAQLAGMRVTLFRVSFSGELAFEINIASDLALALWRKLMEAGREFGIAPYGTEAMHVLRAEKGFVIVGQDTDGSVTPVDLGMSWLLSKHKDFLGKRSLMRPDCVRKDRKQLIGLLSSDARTVLPEGTQLIEEPCGRAPVPMCGHVTSSYRSAVLGHPIALALVAGGRARKGETVHAALPGRDPLPLQIVSPIFYDARGQRQHV